MRDPEIVVEPLQFDRKASVIICPNCPPGVRTQIAVHRKKQKAVDCPRCHTRISL